MKFDIEQFRQLNTIQEMMQYVKQNAKRIGMGAARDAWDTGLGYVIKIGPDANACAQNKKEVRVYEKSLSRLLPKVYEHATDFKWVASEIVKPLKSIFEVNAAIIINTDWMIEDLSDLQIQIRNNRTPTECEWFNDLVRLVKSQDIEVKELHKGNWGINDNGTLVILDTGK
jgi:hypothetical protein